MSANNSPQFSNGQWNSQPSYQGSLSGLLLLIGEEGGFSPDSGWRFSGVERFGRYFNTLSYVYRGHVIRDD